MTTTGLSIERSIAQCRLILSVSALLAVYVDPTLPAGGGLFTISPFALGALSAHLAYAAATYRLLARPHVNLDRLARVTTWGDVTFAMAIALVTEGTSSPFHVFFSFALIAAGFRWGLRRTLVVATASVLLYLSLTALGEHPEDLNLRIMRAVYLGILGYLLGYLGERRLELEETVRELERTAERASIARSLHDGFSQALAGVNLRLQTCRELLRAGRAGDALVQLEDLQGGVTREYDHLRAYVRTLADLETPTAQQSGERRTRFSLRIDCEGSGDLVDHVLQIVREGVANVRRHAHARQAILTVRADDEGLLIRIDDDGVGFPEHAAAPWSMDSRARELGGIVRVLRDGGPGAHVEIRLPASRERA
jgi:signal transduction histidine kinase